MKCFKCTTEIPVTPAHKFSRQDTCPKCHSDLKVCLNCLHFERGRQYDCRETIPELVANKEKANFCDLFLPAPHNGSSASQSREDLLKKAADLFKKPT